MIPKIIHYSWFSGEPFPDHIQKLMETWNEHLSDYEFVFWDAEKLSQINNTFANEAISVKKWAFAADFVRLYAIYTYGGIWLDTDIEIFKSFDPYLNNRVFIGREANFHGYRPKVRWLTAHVFGAEKGHPYIKECMDFIPNVISLEQQTLQFQNYYAMT
jgi:CDP-glycerol glycerophosphotransferase